MSQRGDDEGKQEVMYASGSVDVGGFRRNKPPALALSLIATFSCVGKVRWAQIGGRALPQTTAYTRVQD